LALDKVEIVVADSGGKNMASVTKRAHSPFASITPDGTTLPGWLDDDNVYYFTEKLVYGDKARVMQLVFSRPDGANKRFVQPDIDIAVEEAVEAALKKGK